MSFALCNVHAVAGCLIEIGSRPNRDGVDTDKYRYRYSSWIPNRDGVELRCYHVDNVEGRAGEALPLTGAVVYTASC